MSALSRKVSLLVVTVALTGAPAWGQHLDRGKSGAQLFAASCVDCHHSPRGLAKDRMSWTLSSFLQQHYTSSRESAQVLMDYLQTVDAGRPKGQAAAGKSRAADASVAPPGRL